MTHLSAPLDFRPVPTRAQQTRKVIVVTLENSPVAARGTIVGAKRYCPSESPRQEPSLSELAELIVEALGGEAAISVTQAGAPLSLSPVSHANADSPEVLTEREIRILGLMADGLTKKEIATQAEISVHTVSTHIRNIYEKLQVTTNTGAVAKALRGRLI